MPLTISTRRRVSSYIKPHALNPKKSPASTRRSTKNASGFSDLV
jgi:hypothetical protein